MKNPRDISEERLTLAYEYAKLGERKVELKFLYAEYYKKFRAEHKSDASLERAFELTKDGLELMVITEKQKAKMMKMSALKSLLQVAQSEIFNQY